MARPSNNIDQRLLDAGIALLPQLGCRGLSARKLAEAAGVNLGMFHYHFGSREAFIRTLLEQVYEAMFSRLTMQLEVDEDGAGVASVELLRRALQVLAFFARDRRALLGRILVDALGGEAVAAEFLRANVPRHIAVLARLIAQAQAERALVAVPLPQALGFLAGAVLAPVLAGGALASAGMLPAALGETLDGAVLSDAAIEQRIGFALRGLGVVDTKGDRP